MTGPPICAGDIRTLDDLFAARDSAHGWAVCTELASLAKSRVKARGERALHTISTIELAAMVIVLDVYLEDHPDIRPAAPPAQPVSVSTKGTDI